MCNHDVNQTGVDKRIDDLANALRPRLGELDLSKEIYISCQIGLRGYLAQRILEQHGAKTKNLSGGYRLFETMKLDVQAAE